MPIYFRNDYAGVEREAVVFRLDVPVRANLQEQADEVQFANMWMKNIQDQQRLSCSSDT